jgi:hypothetical protein
MTRHAPLWCFVLLLAACAVGDDPYPIQWGPLPVTGGDCREFTGTYADRGERPTEPLPASLTRELFGEDSPWRSATAVRFDFPSSDVLEVTVTGKDAKPFVRQFTAQKGDLRCDEGRLLLRERRWFYSGTMSGRESIAATLHEAEGHLVVHIRERTTGMMFMAVPLSGDSSRWYRFQRLQVHPK